MKFFKPSWVGHDGNPIFSIDIHPDGTRFATGGQGPEKCGRVIIWNMAPILAPGEEYKSDVPKKLCQMDNHLACTNCVRWSNNGKYLASAGDDKNLMIWQLAGRANHLGASNHHHQAQSSVFESANIEQWRCIATLNGHNGDILDLSWSATDQHLASCSVDNMIIVWDANNFPQIVTKITGHTGLVKGVSWDPVGKYLASQSDDKTLRIWRTSDWREESVVKEPFKGCGGTTHVLRLNWSPDGQTLVSAHAMNNSGSVAQLVERDGWKTHRDLVGHRKAVTCVRFNPNLLYNTKTTKKQNEKTRSYDSDQNNRSSNNNGTNNDNTSTSNSQNGTSKSTGKNAGNNSTTTSKTVKYCCIAVGSRDRSISVWLTSQPRPLIVAHDLFESSVLDISWSKDGYRLLACSQDGTVAAMVFTPFELGHTLTSEERQLHLQKLYGKYINSAPTTTKTLIVEDPELIKAQLDQAAKNREMLDQQQSSHSSMSQNGFNGYESNTSMSGMSKGPTDRQIETLLPGGKRRITPLYIQPSLPFNATSSITFSSSKESKTKIMIETTTSTPVATPTPSYGQTTPIKSQSQQPAANTAANNCSIAITAAATGNTMTPAATASMPATTTTTQTIPTIRREHIIPRTSRMTLEPARIDKATVFRIRGTDDRESILEAENDTNSVKLNELRLMDEANNKVWDTLLSSKINSVIATETLAAASCLDNSLHFFELQSGRRLIPPIILDSPVAHIAAERAHILVITSSANMWLWDLKKLKVLVKGESVASILSPPSNVTKQNKGGHTIQSAGKAQGKSVAGASGDKATSGKSDDHANQANNQPANNSKSQAPDTSGDIEILSCSLTAHYQPLLLLSTGKAFIYDYNLHCWLLISDSNDSITRWSSCKPSVTAMKRFLNTKRVDSSDEMRSMRMNLPLASLQSQHSFDTKRFANLINKNGSESLQVKATRSYLDQQLASALAIKSAHEYHYWLIQSVQHYVDTGAESRLRDLCSRLVSTAFSSGASTSGGRTTSDGVRGGELSSKSEDNSRKEARASHIGRADQMNESVSEQNDITKFTSTSPSSSASSSSLFPSPPSKRSNDINETETNGHILGLNKLSLLKEVLSILSKDLRYQRIYSEYKQMLDYSQMNLG